MYVDDQFGEIVTIWKLKPADRVVHIGPDESLVCALSGSLTQQILIYISGGASGDITRTCPNVHVLNCEIEGANFLPGSVSAVIMAGEPILPREKVVAMKNWLMPGGRIAVAQFIAPRPGSVASLLRAFARRLIAFGVSRAFEAEGLLFEDRMKSASQPYEFLVYRRMT